MNEQLPKNLIYVSDSEPGITRKRWGRGFIYLDQRQQKVRESKTIIRIKSLVIPPAWTGVWICIVDNGYLQVTGRDPRKRKQYIYHHRYVEYRQMSKYRKLVDFGQQLPAIRKQVQADLEGKLWDKRKVTALAVHILDEHHLRIGNDQYEKSNLTFGLTTLRRKHMKLIGGELILQYRGKSGKVRKINLGNGQLQKLVRECSDLPGYELFRYIDEHGKMQSLKSQDVNDYLKDITNYQFTSKDFRTWGGTVGAVEFYKGAKIEIKNYPQRKLENAIVRRVAEMLGNTVTVCREYYIHPLILEFLTTHSNPLPDLRSLVTTRSNYLSKSEQMVLALLRTGSRD